MTSFFIALCKYEAKPNIYTTLKRVLLLLILSLNLEARSQTIIQGEYYFRKTEMVSGFNFSANGRFEFFFTYGAVDRSATGTFKTEGDTLKLKSDKKAGKDFTVTAQSKDATGYTLTFNHPNKYLLKHILCLFITAGKQQEAYTDESGKVHIDLPHCDTIYVQHLLYPDIATLVKDKANNNNRFTLSLNPSLEQVSFTGIDLMIVNDKTLSCFSNYFLPMPDIKFIKQ